MFVMHTDSLIEIAIAKCKEAAQHVKGPVVRVCFICVVSLCVRFAKTHLCASTLSTDCQVRRIVAMSCLISPHRTLHVRPIPSRVCANYIIASSFWRSSSMRVRPPGRPAVSSNAAFCRSQQPPRCVSRQVRICTVHLYVHRGYGYAERARQDERRLIISYLGPGKEVHVFEGRCDGDIVPARGPPNFGWDPIFQPRPGKQT